MDTVIGELSSIEQRCYRFSLSEIQSATNNFDDKLVIGHGGFGKVYKGCYHKEGTSHVAAVKRLDSMSNQGAPEFIAEIQMLSKLRHRHLVSLIGFCDDNQEMILVYEYIHRGTLYDHLHKAFTPLIWVQRVNIATGAARGLDYLHTGTQHGVIHRDVKSSNILLDGNWEAKISDFGLSKTGSTNQTISDVDASVKGTFGYLDPEYYYTHKLTRKSDVYAFGVVLFELLTGRRAVDERYGEEQCSLVRWAQKCVKERKLDEMVDYNIKGEIYPKCLKRFAQIAYRCVHNVPKERPTMTEVVASLQALLELQEKSKFKPKTVLGIKDLKWFTYDEVKLATRDFRNDKWLGNGRYGKVYIGWVDNTDLPIVVKKLHPYKRVDLDALKIFQHPNLVKLLGYCLNDAHLFLVYEFMRKGNFEDLLRSGGLTRLSLVTKVKIVVGIARGLVFLQKNLSKEIWQGFRESRLDRHNILLDEDFTAKLSDYDDSILVHKPDPYIHEVLELTSNPCGYEIVFLEVLTGKRINFSNKALKIDGFFQQFGQESLLRIAKLCFENCNKLNSELKMLTMLKTHDELIQTKFESWLINPES